MTLGEFRQYTETLPDDIEMVAHIGDKKFTINTFVYAKPGRLDLANEAYGLNHLEGILKAVAFLSKHRKTT